MVLLMVEYSVLPDGAHHWRTRTERWLTKAAAGQKAHRATTTTADFGANNAWNDLSDLDQSNQQRLQTAQKEVREGAVSLACICLRCIPNHRAAAVQWQNGKCLPQTHRKSLLMCVSVCVCVCVSECAIVGQDYKNKPLRRVKNRIGYQIKISSPSLLIKYPFLIASLSFHTHRMATTLRSNGVAINTTTTGIITID